MTSSSRTPAWFTTCARAAAASFCISVIEGAPVTNRQRTAFVVMTVLAATVVTAGAQQSVRRLERSAPPVTMQASALARLVGEVAGYPVSVPRVRILWVVDSHALVVESDSI